MRPTAAAKSASSFCPEPLDLYRSTTSGARRGRPAHRKHRVDSAPDTRIAAKHPLSARAIPLVQQEFEVKAVWPGRVHLVNRQLQSFRQIPGHELAVDDFFYASGRQAFAQASLIVAQNCDVD